MNEQIRFWEKIKAFARNPTTKYVAIGVGVGGLIGTFTTYVVVNRKKKIKFYEGKVFVFFEYGNPVIITSAQIIEIKRLYEDGNRLSEIADETNLSQVMVSRVINTFDDIPF